MSEQADKRFEATPARREKAKREGNVARSAELGGIVAFAAAALAAYAALPPLAGTFAVLLRGAAAGAAQPSALGGAAAFALTPMLAAAAAGTAASFAQAHGFRPVALRLDLGRCNPGANLKRLLGTEAAVAGARAAVALTATLAAMIPLAPPLLGAAALASSPAAAARLIAGTAFAAIGIACAAGALFALADYGLARRRWLRGIRMSLDELKREHRENEGDPLAKSQRKRLHRALVRGAIARTRDASFVVVNPTHVAVALRYAPPEVPVPEILVRAADDAALAVRALAREHGIPIVEDVPLARLLYASGASGAPIPAETFVAVAQLIASLARAGLLA